MVQAEEAGQFQLVDQPQLLIEANSCLFFQARIRPITLGKGALADRGQAPDRGLPVGEVGVAVAELLGQVELEPSGQLARSRDRARVSRKARMHLLGRQQDELVVSSPFCLTGLERGVLADGDEHVLEQAAAARVGVHVARCHGLEAEIGRKLAQGGISALVAALVGTLQLDEEAAPERPRQLDRHVRLAHGEPVPGAAREADEALIQLDQFLDGKSRRM